MERLRQTAVLLSTMATLCTTASQIKNRPFFRRLGSCVLCDSGNKTNISLNNVKFWMYQSLDQTQSNSFYGVHQIRRPFPFQLKTEEEPAVETSYTVKNQDNKRSPKEEYNSLSRVQ